jgi:hypothetical protein
MLISVVDSATGKSIPLEVAATDTIAAVKAKVQGVWHIPPELQRLFIAGYDTHDDDLLWDDWRIEPGASISLLVLFKVFVAWIHLR